MIVRRHIFHSLRHNRWAPSLIKFPSQPSHYLSSPISTFISHSRSFSVSSSPSQPKPSIAPIAPAVAAPQTLSSLELLTSDHLKQRETIHLQSAARHLTRRSLAQEAGFRAINDHGLIGQCRTAALVGLDGCIDWMCYPHFDSPSIFAAVVDSERGGHFSVRPLYDGPPYHEQRYEEDSNVLTTVITNQERERQKKSTERRWKRRPSPGAAPQEIAITDFLPMADEEEAEGLHWLIRQLHCKRGPLQADIECFPAFDYGRADQTVEVTAEGVKFLSKGLSMVLTASCPVQWTVSANKKGVFGRIKMEEGQRATLIFRELSSDEVKGSIDLSPLTHADALLERTRKYWRDWMAQCTYRGRWAGSVRRSALALKLLVFAPEGSCVAAPTTSLPETLGGSRCWDYRFAWIRDSSFIIASLLKLGFKAESRAFIGWLQRRADDMEGGVQGHGLQALYGIRGEKGLEEKELTHLRGYLHSRPVRIGNAAYKQIQLDIYGEALETVWLAHTMGAREMDLELWKSLRPCVDWIVAHRQDKDEGVWEVRGGKQSFTYSRLQIWVAVDRAIKLAEELQKKYGGHHSTEAPVSAKVDPSEYGAGHRRSEAVQQRTQKEEGKAKDVKAPAAAEEKGEDSFSVLSSRVTLPGLPASQHMDARSESAAFLSSINPSQPSTNGANSSNEPSSSVLPPELCEGCTIPPPSPNSPEVTSQSTSASSIFSFLFNSSPTPSSSEASTAEVFPGLLTSDLEWWKAIRSSLFDQLLVQAYSDKRQAFVQHVATPPHPCTCTVLDAACLAFPLYGFLPPDHHKITSTLDAILAPIGEGGLQQNSLVYRYNVLHTQDGFGGEEEGTFALCSNWAIEGLAKWGRTGNDAALQRAEMMMEQMVGLSNHLDLYSEELLLHKGKVVAGGATSTEQKEKGLMKEEGKKGGEGVENEGWDDDEVEYEEESDTETRYLQIGNFVQGFSHLAFVNAAIELNEGLNEREQRLSQRDAHTPPQQQEQHQQQTQQLTMQKH